MEMSSLALSIDFLTRGIASFTQKLDRMKGIIILDMLIKKTKDLKIRVLNAS